MPDSFIPDEDDFVEDSFVPDEPLKPDPSMFQRFKAGFMERDIPQPKGFERGDIAEFAGRSGLETIGGTIGGILGAGAGGVATPIAPATTAWGMGIGAAAGKAAHEGIRRGVGAFMPGSTEMEGGGTQVAGRVLGEGVMQGLGGRYLPPVVKGVGKGIAATARGVGRGLGSLARGTSSVSKTAFEGLIDNTKDVLKYMGKVSDEDIVRKGQAIQGILGEGKEAIETEGRSILSKRHEELINAGKEISEQAEFLKIKAVEAGQALQGRIAEIPKKTGREYKAAIDKILGEKSLKYGLPPGAAYPYQIDVQKPLMNTIKTVREEFGYGLPGRIGDKSEMSLFQEFQNRIAEMGKASVDEVYYLQKDLTHQIKLNMGKPIAAALRQLKNKVMSVLDESVPEIRPANIGYKTGMELSDELSGMGSADILADQIHKAFKYGGNKKDALMKFIGSDPESEKIVKTIVSNMDERLNLLEKGKDVAQLSTKIGDLSIIYKLGEAKNMMGKLAEKDPAVKSLLNNVKSKEVIYSRIGNIIEGDNISKQILKTMTEGGNKKDALLDLARENPELGEKLIDIQAAIFGKEFSPWFRELPQTGMGKGILGGLAGAGTFFAPGLVAGSVPLFSPRTVGLATAGLMKSAGAIRQAAGSRPVQGAIQYSTPAIMANRSEQLRRRYMGLR